MIQAKTTRSEKEITGANYIIEFYQNVQLMNETFSVYICVLRDFEERYPNPEKADDPAKDVIKQQIQNTRMILIRCYLQYSAMSKIMKITSKESSAKLEQAYQDVKTKYSIDTSTIEAFTLGMNEVLVQDVVQQLLTSSQSLIQSMFNDVGEQQ